MSKKTEWKETNKFLFTPKYIYPQSISNRFVFVWNKSGSYKSSINYCTNLISSHQIGFVYLIGKIKTELLKKYLKKINANIIVSVFDDEIIEEIENAETISEKYISRGWRKDRLEVLRQEAYPSEELLEYISAIEKLPKLYESFLNKWNAGLKLYGLVNQTISGKDEEHYKALTEIAKQIYPLGIEACESSKEAYKVSKRHQMIKSGLNSKSEFNMLVESVLDVPKIKISMFDFKNNQLLKTYSSYKEASQDTKLKVNAIWRCCSKVSKSTKYNNARVYFTENYDYLDLHKVLIQQISNDFHRQLLDDGYVDIVKFKNKISKQPIGYYECNWYNYILALVLRRYLSKKYYCVLHICTLDATVDNISALILSSENTKPSQKGNSYILFKQSVLQEQYLRLIRKLFNIPKKYNTYHDIGTKVSYWCQNNIKVGNLDYIDRRLYHIVNSSLLEGTNNKVCVCGYEKNYQWLKDNFETIKYKVFHCDEILYNELILLYDKRKVDNYFKRYKSNPSARSWVWSKETLFDEVKYFMEQSIYCSECENEIKEEVDGYCFSKKDVLGINKKLFNATGSNVYCIDCMCNIIGCTSDDIYVKIQEFKEEGCTLF